ncbi:LytTR family DNA-binding domain-containing protein [Lysinibacillus sphaericus]|uniref:Response regulator receiver protein n=1 Tax=Lysinibacillus sphaericus OT4b.31 TaxID=1285586 RepID=R7ZDL1_LYSSH|nr:LytTR family DNA-binding domain-containing protein [Lysinibacillus sphaericus]EON72094.1 response regulator receiver protein [Lysinibacillus sphaericus OT4b.31]
MKIEVSIDPTYQEPKVIILTDKMTEEIEQIMQRIATEEADSSSRGAEMIACKDILRIYTEAKKVFVQTSRGIYTVRSRLYELDKKLNPQIFVRISNAEIVNRNMIKQMDISKTGTIGVVLQGDIKTYASRRYVSKIKKQLGI